MKDIYIISKNNHKIYQTREQRLQEVALGIDNWNELTEKDKEFMLNTCSSMGWHYREYWWEFWKPKIIGYYKKITK